MIEGSDWLLRWFSVLLAGLVFSMTLQADSLSSSAYMIVNQGIFIVFCCYLLLPAANSFRVILFNSIAGIPVLIVLLQLPVAGMVPVPVSLRISIIMMVLSVFLWSLKQLLETLFNKHKMRNPIVVFSAIAICAPIWLGPLVDIYQPDNRIINSIISLTPLTHFSVAAEYDFLRSVWFYQNTPFGSLPFTYPSFISIITGYLFLIVTLQIIRHWISPTVDSTPTQIFTLTNS